jgi:RNA recognition motif-containing protein
MGRKLYVGNLPYTASEQDLQDLFASAGGVESVNLMRDMATGRARGFAFVEMVSDDDAQKAIDQLNNTDFGGRNLTVNEARPKTAGGGGGGRGMGAAPMTVTQTGDTLTIEQTMGDNKVTRTYKLDGTESVNKMVGRGGEVETKSTAKWDGAKLTITTKQAAPDGTVRESTQTWSLEGGNLVIDSTRTGREGTPVTAKVTYKKTT